ncbi:AIR synthase-related protein [Streptomyces longispororuber]|uniref:AIR synthase-related protein n=1 Tax=Streptomyces longispororuber TaxID=68230 RepID=UPI0035AC0664
MARAAVDAAPGSPRPPPAPGPVTPYSSVDSWTPRHRHPLHPRGPRLRSRDRLRHPAPAPARHGARSLRRTRARTARSPWGGVAAALKEIARDAHIGVEIEEGAVPVPPAGDLLGLDPLVVANEGCFVAFIAPHAADAALDALHALPEGTAAVRIGTAVKASAGRVVLRTLVGGKRIVDMPLGEQLPRIC